MYVSFSTQRSLNIDYFNIRQDRNGRSKDKFLPPDHYIKMKPYASFISLSLNWLLNSLSKKYICIKTWSAPEKLSQFLASCSRLTIQTLWNADTMSFPTYSHPNLFFKIRSSLFIRSCYYPREIVLGSWHLQDWGFTLPLTSAESISLWYSQSYYSLIEIIIVSGHHIHEQYGTLEMAIEDYVCSLLLSRRWRLKTMYAPCCSRRTCSSCHGRWSDGERQGEI